jgi:class 3 adenylate cyclase
MFLYLLFNEYEFGLKQLWLAERGLDTLMASIYLPLFYFHGALTALGSLSSGTRSRREERWAARAAKRLAHWAASNPATNEHRLLLVQAELQRVRGDFEAARFGYDRAIDGARRAGCVPEEALANETAARFYDSRGQERIAQMYLGQARYGYERWGAAAKVAQLDAGTKSGTIPPRLEQPAAPSLDNDALDLQSVMKAAEAISREISLPSLLEQLLRICLQSAGAQSGCVLLETDGKLFLEARLTDGETTELMSHKPLEQVDDIPAELVHVALHQSRPVVLSNAHREGDFARAPAISRRKVMSVLCLPIGNPEKQRAVLYLENNLSEGVFSGERQRLLHVLSSQAAISIENALLYSNLERSLNEQVRLTTAQARFVPDRFLSNLGRTNIASVELGDSTERHMAVLFSDIRKFASLVEGMTPAQNIRFINDYLGKMEPCILREGGLIDSYIGDAIMALFDTEQDAIRAAVAMLGALSEFNEERKQKGLKPVAVGLGINSGLLTLGTIGGRNRIKCGVIGDCVNLAARIETATKQYGCSLLVSGTTLDRCSPDQFDSREIDLVRVVGREQPVSLFEVFDADDAPTRKRKRDNSELWRESRSAYMSGDFQNAKTAFERYGARVPEDPVARLFAERCAAYLESPPTDGWDGIENLRSK